MSTVEHSINTSREFTKLTSRVMTALMSTVDGRAWVWAELAHAQLFMNDESVDPYRMAFEKGRRNQAARLHAAVTVHTPALYVRMLEENSGVRLTAAAATEEQADG